MSRCHHDGGGELQIHQEDMEIMQTTLRPKTKVNSSCCGYCGHAQTQLTVKGHK